MRTLLLPLAAALLAAPAIAQRPAPSVEDRVDALFARWASDSTPGVAVAVVRDGELVLSRGYGRATLEHPSPIGGTTPFHVASVSKQFTAFAIALLAEEGRISLDEEVRAYLPELPDPGHRVTVRQLVHHTSGLRDQWELLLLAGWRLDDVITRDHVLELVRHQRGLNFEPGTEHLYSNTGYTLMAEIVSRVTGVPFPAWMEENVFAPLGMASTHFHDDHEHVVPGRAYSYAPRPEGGWRNAVLSYANAGATSLFTTAEDLARWIRNLETGEVGGAAVRERMRERGVLASGDTLAYAFALAHGSYRGVATLQHTGSDAGFRSLLAYVPEHRLGVVLLSNAANVDLGGGIRGIFDLYLEEVLGEVEALPAAAPPPPAAEWAPASTAEYAGRYRSEELGTEYEVMEGAEGLVMRHRRHGAMALLPRAPDEFALAFPRMRPGYFRVTFDRDAAGRVTGFRFQGGRVRDLVVPRH